MEDCCRGRTEFEQCSLYETLLDWCPLAMVRLSNPGCTTAQLCFCVRWGRVGNSVAVSAGANFSYPRPLLPVLCLSPVALWLPKQWHCRDIWWWPVEGPSLLFLRLNSSQGKTIGNVVPLVGLCLPLACLILALHIGTVCSMLPHLTLGP